MYENEYMLRGKKVLKKLNFIFYMSHIHMMSSFAMYYCVLYTYLTISICMYDSLTILNVDKYFTIGKKRISRSFKELKIKAKYLK